MENKLFTIVNKEDEASFLTDLSNNTNNFNKKLVFVFGNSENCIVVNGKKFLHKPESAERAPVDLGLPSGTLWAAGNIGAELPWETGKYFAWGETTGYTGEQVTSRVREFNQASYTASSISADLTLEQDAAHVNLGGNWRMPTKNEYQELIDNCNIVWIDNYNGKGVNGKVFTSKFNGNSVFFPAASFCVDDWISRIGFNGDYWVTSFNDSVSGWYFSFDSGGQGISVVTRKFGLSVRGVYK